MVTYGQEIISPYVHSYSYLLPSGRPLHQYGKIHHFYGQIHFLWPFSIVMLVTRRYLISTEALKPTQTIACLATKMAPHQTHSLGFIHPGLTLQYWLVVEPPLSKVWVRQLGWWHSQIYGKIKLMEKYGKNTFPSQVYGHSQLNGKNQHFPNHQPEEFLSPHPPWQWKTQISSVRRNQTPRHWRVSHFTRAT